MTEPDDWKTWARGCVEDPASPSKLKEGHLAMLTGQDTRCLDAIVACWALYARSDEAGANAAIAAIRILLTGMQPKCWVWVKELIPYAMDWSDREKLWPLIEGERLPASDEART